jgi:hypothetical protein
MKLLKVMKDGGPKSHVTGFFLIEIKSLFSVVLLKFGKGTREAYHSHAFDAATLWIKGHVTEHLLDGTSRDWAAGDLKYTARNCFHKVFAHVDSYAVSVRGPWAKTWKEYLPAEDKFVTLTHGRKVVA